MKHTFSSLRLDDNYVEYLTGQGITVPTPIQVQAIPVLLDGRDLTAQAQTGTGKTLAFLLPMMKSIDPALPHVQALIITPTRELALQITNEARKLAELKKITVLAAYGGQDVMRQIHKLKGKPHIVIGTPGRLLDHIERKTVNFTKIHMLVLDEADLMLDMGFQRDVERIIHSCAQKRQTVLCSATLPQPIVALAARHQKNPVHLSMKSESVTLDNISQLVIETTETNKQRDFDAILAEMKPFMAIIFCRTKRRAQTLNRTLLQQGYSSEELHGDMTQGQRENAMKSFRNSKIQYLVATDVAARGLDIEGVSHVFNFDVPRNAEGYIHRIGRTGRAGNPGHSITFVTPADRHTLTKIEKIIKMSIKKRTLSHKAGPKLPDESTPVKSVPRREAQHGRKENSSRRQGNDRDNKQRTFSRDRRPVNGNRKVSSDEYRSGERQEYTNSSAENKKRPAPHASSFSSKDRKPRQEKPVNAGKGRSPYPSKKHYLSEKTSHPKSDKQQPGDEQSSRSAGPSRRPSFHSEDKRTPRSNKGNKTGFSGQRDRQERQDSRGQANTKSKPVRGNNMDESRVYSGNQESQSRPSKRSSAPKNAERGSGSTFYERYYSNGKPKKKVSGNDKKKKGDGQLP